MYEPWNIRTDWTVGICSSNRLTRLTAHWGHMCIGIVFFFLLVIAKIPTLRDELSVSLFVTVFYALVLFAVTALGREILRTRRYGKSVFHLSQVPGVVGGELRGVIAAPVELCRAKEIRLRLKCQTDKRRQGRQGGLSYLTVWETEQRSTATQHPAHCWMAEVSAAFTIPPDALESNPDSLDPNRVTCRWLLQVEAPLPGVDYADEFEVPVFRMTEPPKQLARPHKLCTAN